MRPIQWCRTEFTIFRRRARDQYHRVGKQALEVKPIKADGFILDIGGGGEGIVGRLNGIQVVSIDKSYSELEETHNEALKIVMDATNLKFLDDTFTLAISFFSLMYIPNVHLTRVFSEIYRVLKPGGKLAIWDAVIPAEFEKKKFFVLPLKIILPEETVETRYLVKIKEQSPHTIQTVAHDAGFLTVNETTNDNIFYLELEK